MKCVFLVTVAAAAALACILMQAKTSKAVPLSEERSTSSPILIDGFRLSLLKVEDSLYMTIVNQNRMPFAVYRYSGGQFYMRMMVSTNGGAWTDPVEIPYDQWDPSRNTQHDWDYIDAGDSLTIVIGGQVIDPNKVKKGDRIRLDWLPNSDTTQFLPQQYKQFPSRRISTEFVVQ